MRTGSILLLAAGLQHASSLHVDFSSQASISNASTALAFNLMSYYKNNLTGVAATAVGTFPQPLYWWEAGAIWGGMIDYWAYTNDTSYNPTVTQALLAQTGSDNNFMPVAYYSSLGNDDQAFWAMAALSAVEYGFPNAPGRNATWISLAEAVFNTMVPRWNTSLCNGGLRWQIFPSNAGYDYRNSISNGGFFQIAARLARYTGNQTYYDWAERIWDWTTGVGLIGPDYSVFDGTGDTTNCTSIDHTQWTYNPAVFIYGTAMLYNHTNGSEIWAKRTTGLIEAVNTTFFQAYKNASGIMVEPACEPLNKCDDDQFSFKAYLARWLAKTTIVAPFTASAIRPLLNASAHAAAVACSGGGGPDDATCGEKWYVGGFDGYYGVGQQLSALEVMQSLLIGDAPAPLTNGQVGIETAPTSSIASETPSATPSALFASQTPASPSKNAVSGAGKIGGAVLGTVWGLVALGLV